MRSRALMLLVIGVLMALVPVVTPAADAEDRLGNWLIWNGTVRYSDRWSLFTDSQVRLFEPIWNLQETLFRVAGHLDLSEQAMVGVGILRADTWEFDDPDEDGRVKEENRLYAQFAFTHQLWRSGLEHRYRFEERWIKELDEGTERHERFRYRLQVTTPLNSHEMGPGVTFLNIYDEIFINLGGDRDFDQNRFYVAGGRQFTDHSNLQLGVLWQARPDSMDFFRLQAFYTHNFDLRD